MDITSLWFIVSVFSYQLLDFNILFMQSAKNNCYIHVLHINVLMFRSMFKLLKSSH